MFVSQTSLKNSEKLFLAYHHHHQRQNGEQNLKNQLGNFHQKFDDVIFVRKLSKIQKLSFLLSGSLYHRDSVVDFESTETRMQAWRYKLIIVFQINKRDFHFSLWLSFFISFVIDCFFFWFSSKICVFHSVFSFKSSKLNFLIYFPCFHRSTWIDYVDRID